MCTLLLPSVKVSTLPVALPGSSAQSPFTLARRLPPLHWPLPHVSVREHSLPSSQGVPAGCSLVRQPSAELQLANRHWLAGGGQTTAPPPRQVPAPSQVSPLVQASTSSHL